MELIRGSVAGLVAAIAGRRQTVLAFKCAVESRLGLIADIEGNLRDALSGCRQSTGAQTQPPPHKVRHRRFAQKTLQLNFWRPGDEFFETDREIRLGQPNNVEYSWEYK